MKLCQSFEFADGDVSGEFSDSVTEDQRTLLVEGLAHLKRDAQESLEIQRFASQVGPVPAARIDALEDKITAISELQDLLARYR